MKTINCILALAILFAATSGCAQKTETTRDFESEGYTSMFNGNDLSGWKIPEGDNGHWKVVDGVIDYDALSEAEGNKSLYSEKNYQDFKLHVEWRFKKHSNLFPMPVVLPNGNVAKDPETGETLKFMEPNADSGILLKEGSQINIWCWRVGSGELWTIRNNRDLPQEERAKAVPKFHADNPVGEWNAYDITLKGNRVTIYLNDILVIEDCLYTTEDNPQDGPIGLQHHGRYNEETGEYDGASSLIQFRNIWIKEL